MGVSPLVNTLKEDIDNGKYKILVSDEKSGRIPAIVLKEIIKMRSGNSPKTYFVAGPRFEIHHQKLMSTDNYKNISKEIFKNSNHTGDVLIISEGVETGETLSYLLRDLEKESVIADIGVINIVRGGTFNRILFNLVGGGLQEKIGYNYTNKDVMDMIKKKRGGYECIIDHNEHRHYFRFGGLGNYAKFSVEPLGVYKDRKAMVIKSLKQKIREWKNKYKGEELEEFKEFLDDFRIMSFSGLKEKWRGTVYWKEFIDKEEFISGGDSVFKFYDDKTIQENIKKSREDIKLLAHKTLQKIW